MTIRAPDPFLGPKEGRSFGVFRPKKTECSPARRVGRSEQAESETRKIVREGRSPRSVWDAGGPYFQLRTPVLSAGPSPNRCRVVSLPVPELIFISFVTPGPLFVTPSYQGVPHIFFTHI